MPTSDMTDAAPIYVALDFPDGDSALRMVDQLSGVIGYFKVGLELLHSAGPEIVQRVRAAGAAGIFFDGKFHDIPNTVAGATRAAVRAGATLLNVHAGGGSAMMQAALHAAETESAAAGTARPQVIAVTVLTSMDADALRSTGIPDAPAAQVVRLARLTQAAGLDGVVASPREVEAIRAACGPEFFIITPGVRPNWAGSQDQKRVATPAEALRAGASALVIGRPITGAEDPRSAAQRVIEECAEVEG